jgi:predicted AAA+ superfamily ATPase
MSEKYYERSLLRELKKWLPRREILAIKGPRQAGKTTLIRILSEWLEKDKGISTSRLHSFTFEDLEILEKFVTDPKGFIDSYLDGKETHYLFLDEFHYAKEGGRKLKLLYDTKENVKFIVTGSSSLEITQFSRFLVGRVFSFHLLPFSFWEFLNAKDKRILNIYEGKNKLLTDFIFKGRNFSVKRDIMTKEISRLFEEYALFGGYPEVVKAKDRETKMTILKNIYETYITKDIIGLLKISDMFKFKKAVSLLSSQIGGILNYNEISTSIGSYYKDIIDILNTLEETYVIRLTRPFFRNLKTELRKNPKVFFLDSGLRNYAVRDFNPLEIRSDRGILVENVVHNMLTSMLGYSEKINYWRTLSKAEVDFVISRGNELIPIEVKFSSLKKPKISRSFRSFIDSYNPDRAVVATRDFWGDKKVGRTRIKFVPVCYF